MTRISFSNHINGKSANCCDGDIICLVEDEVGHDSGGICRVLDPAISSGFKLNAESSYLLIFTRMP